MNLLTALVEIFLYLVVGQIVRIADDVTPERIWPSIHPELIPFIWVFLLLFEVLKLKRKMTKKQNVDTD